MESKSLQSREHRDLLDVIDKLRSQGISKYVDLPEIIVCGDQSSGKSSVLEAISGMSFPSKDNLCTRFATELVLRRHPTTAIKVSITPAPERSTAEKDDLLAFKPELDVDKDGLGLGSVIESAKEAMGLSDTRVFSTDVLRVELCGPSQPHLTMVDLPGLFRAGNRDQSASDAATVRDMVWNYMKRPRSIILAVVSAKSDFALQEVTELARELDPTGGRTLGLITKPDTLDAGSDSERAYLKLAQNKDVVFRLGWHVLKNRDFKMRAATSLERDEDEERFFSQGVWTSLDPGSMGIKTLKPRLSNLLKDQILHELPDLLRDVERGISDCQHKLSLLGSSRQTIRQQRSYLSQVSQEFSILTRAAVDGVYRDPFFGSATTETGYQKRLRAVIQNVLTEFEGNMRKQGQTRIIVESQAQGKLLEKTSWITRSDYINQVKDLMNKSRACELPGTFNPLIIGELFLEQCRPWQTISQDLKAQVFKFVNQTVQMIINHVAVQETADKIFRIIDEGLQEMRNEVDTKITELLNPHFNGHPITYNHYLTETVQKIQASRRKDDVDKTLRKAIGVTEDQSVLPRLGMRTVDVDSILSILVQRTELDMGRYASSMAVDYMQAYYKVALKKFVDDVGILAIEHCLIRKLPTLFTPNMVLEMEDEQISHLAGESKEAVTERARYTQKLDVMESGLRELKYLDSHRGIPATNPAEDIKVEDDTKMGIVT